jgi:hypothetical protein
MATRAAPRAERECRVELLLRHCRRRIGDAGQVAARVGEGGHQTLADRVGDNSKNDGMTAVACCHSP